MSKHGWTYKKLGEVASYINGFAFKPETWSERGIPIIRIQNLNNEEAPFNFYDGELDEKFIVRDDDLLISWSASLGVYIWKRGLAYLNQHIFKVRFDKGNINKYYLAYSVESKLAEMSKNTHGSTMRHIVKKDFDNIKIPVPSMAEQEAIVAELDEINEAIAELQQQVADLDTLAQSTFYDMFGDPVTNPKGWEVKKLGDVAHYSSTRVSATELNPSNYVGVDNLLKDKQGKIDASFYPTDGNVTAYKIGDTLLGNIRPYLKKIWYADSNGGASGDVLVIQVNEDMKSQIHPFFIYYTLSLDAFFDFDMLHSKGAKMPRGSKPEIMKFPICKPPLALQQEFASRVEAIEEAKAELNAQIAEMQTLLASRMDYYFD